MNRGALLPKQCLRFTVYRMAERGELSGATIARRWRFTEADIKRWVERKKRARNV